MRAAGSLAWAGVLNTHCYAWVLLGNHAHFLFIFIGNTPLGYEN
jgi:hypothetical protein